MQIMECRTIYKNPIISLVWLLQIRIWSVSTAMSMYVEFSAIITCRVMYIVFRPHRFVVNFGYGFDADDAAMTSVATIVVSMFIELAFEAVVDGMALTIEFKNGVDLNKFWKMWRVNAYAFWGVITCDGINAMLMTTWAFKLIPDAIFCESPTDPCSCRGGGFEIYEKFCNPEVTKDGNKTLNITAPSPEQSKQEFQGIFEVLDSSASQTLVVIAVVLLLAAVFAVAFMYYESLQATAQARILSLKEMERSMSSHCCFHFRSLMPPCGACDLLQELYICIYLKPQLKRRAP